MEKKESHNLLYKQILKMSRLSFGELALPGEERFIARYKFIISIRENAPEVFIDLKNYVSLYGDLLPAIRNCFSDKNKIWFTFEEVEKVIDDIQVAKELIDGLLKWAEKWNINEKWIIASGFHIIVSWYANPDLIDDIIVHPVELREFFNNRNSDIQKIKNHPTYPASPPSFKPYAESKNEYNERIDDYIRKVENIFLEYSWEFPKSKRNFGGGIQIHYHWIVKYRILKMSYVKIALEYIDSDPNEELYISAKSVKKAIERVSKVIELPIRKKKAT